MANAINYAAVFNRILDEKFYILPRTMWMEDTNPGIVWEGGKEVKIPKLGMDGLGTMNGYKAEPSEELNKLVETSLKGAAELAAKVGAAIATSGGSVAGDAAYTALRNAISKYISKGGDASKAKITCENGNCTISDGTVTETCTDCIYSGN